MVNLDHGPYQLSGADDPVSFDIDADGDMERITWTGRGTAIAFLAIDRNANGQIDNGAELFGNFTPLRSGAKAANGFEALKELDANGDGLVDRNDSGWDGLLVWLDANHDGTSDATEIRGVAATTIVALETDYATIGRRDEYGNLFKYQSHVRLNRGKRAIYDVYFQSIR